jgi:hypothetical protein
MNDHFLGKFTDAKGNEHPIDFHSNDEPAFSGEPYLIIAALFLGVTSMPRDPAYDDEDVHRQVEPEHLPPPAVGYGGIGLHLVRKTVVDGFGGSLHYATGSYRLTVKRTGGAGPYETTLNELPPEEPRVKGNLLWVRVPVDPSEPQTPNRPVRATR